MLTRGNYYLRITARDSANPTENSQVASNVYYSNQPDATYYGVVAFSVDIDGVPQPAMITIDGDPTDWNGLPFWIDPDDIAQPNTVDWRQFWFTQNSENIYLA